MVYLDHAATTPTAPQVRAAMEPYYNRRYGNASTPYEFGQMSREAVENARKTIADTLGAEPSEIYFTSGGTESDNWALKATMEAYSSFGRHMITTKIEHHAIGNTCEYLKKRGFEVTELPVDQSGRIFPEQLEYAIRPDTVLISVMCANNEIGAACCFTRTPCRPTVIYRSILRGGTCICFLPAVTNFTGRRAADFCT